MAGIALLVVASMLVRFWPSAGGTASPVVAADPGTVTIVAGAPASIDPAHHGDLGSASYVSQLYESLTAVDPSLVVRPALAESWTIEDEGRRVTFTLRDGLEFSDGSPLTAADVVHSWRRLFDPQQPSPLASLIADVTGARDLLGGKSTDVTTLGVRADGDRRVVVDLERGGGDLPAIVSGAPFAVVPASTGDAEIVPSPGDMVGSGGYTLAQIEDDAFVLKANPHYWAGEPAIGTVRMLTTLNGASPVDAFVAGDVDVTPIGFLDAGWIAYDRDLGPVAPQRPVAVGDLLRVRHAREAVRRRPGPAGVRAGGRLAAARGARRARLVRRGHRDGARRHARGAVGRLPAAVRPGRRAPAARGGRLPDRRRPRSRSRSSPTGAATTRRSWRCCEDNLGVTIDYATMDFQSYQARLATDPPRLWSLSWVADYPGPNDFLGVLLETGSTANQGGWSSAAFDAAISDATAAGDPATAEAAYARAMGIVRDEVPVVPVSYGTSFSLVRDGLLGASQSGLGILRLAGLAWDQNR